MRNRVVVAALCVFFSAASSPRAARADELSRLVRKADMITRAKTSAAVFAMDIKTSSYQRRMRVVVWNDSRGTDKTLIKILGPALWRGYGTLKIGSQLKLYNPRNNHVTVVGHSMLGDSWMGSHFSNDDLVKETRLAKHYRQKLIKSYQADAPGGRAKYYLVRLLPKPTAPVAWGRIDYLLWERGETVVPVRAAYYRKAKDRKPTRRIRFDHIQQLGGRTMPSQMTIEVMSKPGEYTRLTYRKIRFNVSVPASKFTEQALRR